MTSLTARSLGTLQSIPSATSLFDRVLILVVPKSASLRTAGFWYVHQVMLDSMCVDSREA